MPSMKNLQLFLLAVLLPLAVRSDPLPGAPADLPETSGDELQDSAGAFEHRKWLYLAKGLLSDVARLRDEQFQRDFGEPTTNMTNYATLRIHTPLITTPDGCHSRNFSAQRCLRRIYAGLSTYREYLSYVERQNLTAVQFTDINLRTTSLLHVIKEKVDTQIQLDTISPLPEGSAWTQRTVAHSVLYNLASFLTDTSRAIHYINKKGVNHTRKDVKEIKETQWSSDKHSHE